MPKPISNENQPENNGHYPSLICKLSTEGKISPDKLYCCSQEKGCIPDATDCYGSSNIVGQCRNINNLDACQKRTDLKDLNARRVCDWPDYFFCLSTAGTSSWRKEYFESMKWMISRNKVEESINNVNSMGNVIACYNGTSYQLDNGSSCSTGSVTCGDLFSKEYKCNWKSGDEAIDRYPLGEVCENFLIPTTTATPTVTITLSPNSENNPALVSGLAVGTAVGGFGSLLLIGGIIWWKHKTG